jgi:hypothetical protein
MLKKHLLNLTTKNKFALSCFTILMIYLLPNWLFWEGSQYLIHDNLDSNVVWYKNLAESGNMFSYADDAIIPQTLGGLSRIFYPSELSIMTLLYLVFSPFVAYNLNILILHLIAFIGMYLLISSSKLLKGDSSEIIAWGVALCFSLIPFWPSGGLTIAGQPLLIWAILNIYRSRRSTASWGVVLMFPFYSSLVLGNLFLYLSLGFLFLTYSIRLRQLNLKVLLAFVVLLSLSILIEHRLFSLFIDGIPTQRDTWLEKEATLNLNGLIGVSIQMLLKGQYHFFGRIFPIIPIVSLIGFLVASKKVKKYMMFFLGLAVVFSVIRVSRSFSLVVDNAPFFSKFNPRFHSMLPFLWFLILTLALCAVHEYHRLGRYFVGFAIVAVVITNLFNLFTKDFQGSEFLENSFYFTFIAPEDNSASSIADYYQTDQFSMLKSQIGLVDSYVACVGIIPEVAQYNGYKTLGGYYPVWPLDYCQRIKKLKNTMGFSCDRRCYFTKEDIERDGFSVEELAALNCSTILSNTRITSLRSNFEETNIETDAQSFFIYKLNTH